MRLYLLFLFCISTLTSYSQDNSFFQNWSLELQYGIQKHDKRFFDYSDASRFLSRQREDYGTYQYGITLSKNIIIDKIFSNSIGIGWAREMNTFNRPYFKYADLLGGYNVIRPSILFLTRGHYRIEFIQTPLKIETRLFEYLLVELQILPLFDIYREVGTSTRRLDTELGLRFYSAEFNLGIGTQIRNFNLGVRYRLFQAKKVDEILFSEVIMKPDNPKLDDEWETFNPTKFIFYVGYNF